MIVTDDAGDRLGDLTNGGMRRGELGLRAALRGGGERVEQDADGGDRLPDLVVELAGDTAPLGVEAYAAAGA